MSGGVRSGGRWRVAHERIRSLIATAATSINPVQCPSLPGVEFLISQPQLRFIIVGEQHGTAEVPAMFGDLVCHLASSWKIVVGIEFAASMAAMGD